MFSWLKFGKKQVKPSINLLVWQTQIEKWKYIYELSQAEKENNACLWIAYFPETYTEFCKLNNTQKNVWLATDFCQECNKYKENENNLLLGIEKIYILENHPNYNKETNILDLINAAAQRFNRVFKVTFYGSLEENIFKHFRGENITRLLKLLEIQENESISHSMIYSSLVRGQKKIAETLKNEQESYSMKEWWEKNMPSK
jgi:hypothetical protein